MKHDYRLSSRSTHSAFLYKPAVALCTVLGLTCWPMHTAWANDTAAEADKSGGVVSFGVAHAPEYSGAKEQRTQGTFAADYQWSNGLFLGTGGFGFNASQNQAVQWGPIIGFGQDRKENVSSHLKGMGDVAGNVEYGGFVNAQVAPGLQLNAKFMSGTGSERKGNLLSVGLGYKLPMGQNLEVGLGLGANFANSAYLNTYYGVNAEQASSSGHSSYAMSDGLRDVSADVSLSYQVAPQWAVVGGVQRSALSDAVRKSPLVRKDTQNTVYLGVAYSF